MRESFISVPLPGEHYDPRIRLILHNRGRMDDPVTYVTFDIRKCDEIDPDWVVEQPYLKGMLRRQTSARIPQPNGAWQRVPTTVRQSIEVRYLTCFYLGVPASPEEAREREQTHLWRLRYQTENGMARYDFPMKPSEEELEAFYVKNRVLPFMRRNKPRMPTTRLIALRRWCLEPVSYRFLLKFVFADKPILERAWDHMHNFRMESRIVGVVGQKKENAFIPAVIPIVDMAARALVLLPCDLFAKIFHGRKAITKLPWWEAWWAANSDPVAPPEEDPNLEALAKEDEDREEVEEVEEEEVEPAMPAAADIRVEPLPEQPAPDPRDEEAHSLLTAPIGDQLAEKSSANSN